MTSEQLPAEQEPFVVSDAISTSHCDAQPREAIRVLIGANVRL